MYIYYIVYLFILNIYICHKLGKKELQEKKQKTRKKMSTVDKMVEIFKQYPKYFHVDIFVFKGNLRKKCATNVLF